jgi:drug/metabolite transporter (DMT)-like permease
MLRHHVVMVHRTRWLIVAGVLLLAGVVLALVPVSGTFDSERFHCGTPFHYDNSGGYAGSEGFADCTSRREALRYPAAGLIIAGLGIGGAAFARGRGRGRGRSQADQETRAVR